MKLAKEGKLTSSVFTDKNPPKSWQDCCFLEPHEMVRRETIGFGTSVDALHDASSHWQLTLLARWYIENYHEMVKERKLVRYVVCRRTCLSS